MTAFRQVVRIHEARQITGLCRSEIYRKAKDPTDSFPAPIQLSESAIGFFRDELEAWRDARPRSVEKINYQPPAAA
jgi:predicted DNA-binding transcriptional regulator AlpA